MTQKPEININCTFVYKDCLFETDDSGATFTLINIYKGSNIKELPTEDEVRQHYNQYFSKNNVSIKIPKLLKTGDHTTNRNNDMILEFIEELETRLELLDEYIQKIACRIEQMDIRNKIEHIKDRLPI